MSSPAGRPDVVTCDECVFASRGWPKFRAHQREVHDRGLKPSWTDAQRAMFYYYRHLRERIAYQTRRNRRLQRTSPKYRAMKRASFLRWWRKKSEDPVWRAARVVKNRERMAALRLRDPKEWKRQNGVRRGAWAWQRVGHSNFRSARPSETRDLELRKCGRCGNPVHVTSLRAPVVEEGPPPWTKAAASFNPRVFAGDPLGSVSWCPKCGVAFPPAEHVLREQLRRAEGRADGRFTNAFPIWWDQSESVRRSWETRRARYGPNGWKPGMEHGGWETRRARYGPTGMRQRIGLASSSTGVPA
jgi:hypothetical protein